MDLHRLQRTSKSVTIWKEKDVSSVVKNPKIIKKSTRTEKKTVLKPITVGSFLCRPPLVTATPAVGTRALMWVMVG